MKPKSTTKILIAISLVFVIPLLLAWWCYTHQDALVWGTVNRGALLKPLHNIASLNLSDNTGKPFTAQQSRGHWWLIYFAPQNCGKTCQTDLYYLRQIRIATGKDRLRIKCALLTFRNDASADLLLQREYPGTQYLLTNRQQFQQVLHDLPSTTLAFQQGYLYLVDPLGNLALGYAPVLHPEDLLQDLQRLLRISQIG